jgi:hypothetical protein
VFSLRRRGDGGEEEGAVALDATAVEQLATAILGELEQQLRQVLDGFAQRVDRVERRVDELSQAVHDQRRAGAEIAAQVSSTLLKDLIASVAGSRAGGEVNLEPVVSRLDGVADGLEGLGGEAAPARGRAGGQGGRGAGWRSRSRSWGARPRPWASWARAWSAWRSRLTASTSGCARSRSR